MSSLWWPLWQWRLSDYCCIWFFIIIEFSSFHFTLCEIFHYNSFYLLISKLFTLWTAAAYSKWYFKLKLRSSMLSHKNSVCTQWSSLPYYTAYIILYFFFVFLVFNFFCGAQIVYNVHHRHCQIHLVLWHAPLFLLIFCGAPIAYLVYAIIIKLTYSKQLHSKICPLLLSFNFICVKFEKVVLRFS